MSQPLGGGAPQAGEEVVPTSTIRYTWHDEDVTTYCEIITYKNSSTSLGTRVTLENTSTLHTGVASATDSTGAPVVTVDVTAPFALRSWDISKLRLRFGDGESATSDRYGVNLSMKG